MIFTTKAAPTTSKTHEQAKFWPRPGSNQEKRRAWCFELSPGWFSEAWLDLGSWNRELMCYSLTVDPVIEFV